MKCTFLFSGLGLRLRANRNDDVHKKIRQYIYIGRERERKKHKAHNKNEQQKSHANPKTKATTVKIVLCAWNESSKNINKQKIHSTIVSSTIFKSLTLLIILVF